jgi:hypothetical protein
MINPKLCSVLEKIMRKITIFLIVFLLFICTNLCFAQFSKSGTAAAQFLKIGVGARAMAMGGAFGSLADDATALYWNPSGLVLMDKPTLYGSHTRWFADISYQFAGVVIPLGRTGVIGVSAIFLNMDEIEITTIEQPHGTGEFFDASDLAIGFSFARWITDRFSIGFTGKYINQKIYNETATGLAIDIGTRLRTGFYGLVIGMNYSNIGGKMQLSGRDLLRGYDNNPESSTNPYVDSYLNTELWALPTNFRISMSMDIIGGETSIFHSANNLLTLCVDGNHPTDGQEKASIGLEYQWRRLFALRFGYKINYDDESLAFGAGFNLHASGRDIHIDFAYLPFDKLNDIRILSFSFQL